MRLSLEVAQLVRDEFDGPLFYRVSASDWSEGPEKEDDEYRQWGIEQSCVCLHLLRFSSLVASDLLRFIRSSLGSSRRSESTSSTSLLAASTSLKRPVPSFQFLIPRS